MRSLYALVVTFMYVQHYVHQQFHWSRKCFTFVTDIFPVSKPLPQRAQKLHKHWSSMPNVLHVSVWSKALIKRCQFAKLLLSEKFADPHLRKFPPGYTGLGFRWSSVVHVFVALRVFGRVEQSPQHLLEHSLLLWKSWCTQFWQNVLC